MATLRADELGVQHTDYDDDEEEEDPYELYVLRRPHERASQLVPQLAKQPEMADTRLRYRRIAPENDPSGSTYPRRFEFPNRSSQLESLTSDDESTISSIYDARSALAEASPSRGMLAADQPEPAHPEQRRRRILRRSARAFADEPIEKPSRRRSARASTNAEESSEKPSRRRSARNVPPVSTEEEEPPSRRRRSRRAAATAAAAEEGDDPAPSRLRSARTSPESADGPSSRRWGSRTAQSGDASRRRSAGAAGSGAAEAETQPSRRRSARAPAEPAAPFMSDPTASASSSVSSGSNVSRADSSPTALTVWDGRKICAPAAYRPEQARNFALVPETPALAAATQRVSLPYADAVVRRRRPAQFGDMSQVARMHSNPERPTHASRTRSERPPPAARMPSHYARPPVAPYGTPSAHATVPAPGTSRPVPLRVEHPNLGDDTTVKSRASTRRRRRRHRARRTSHRLRAYAVSPSAKVRAATGISTRRGSGALERDRDLSIVSTRVRGKQTSATGPSAALRRVLKALRIGAKQR